MRPLDHLYLRISGANETGRADLAAKLSQFIPGVSVFFEWCYSYDGSTLTDHGRTVLASLLGRASEPTALSNESCLDTSTVIEIGPRLNFQTQWSTTTVTILKACGVSVVDRIERSLRIGFDLDISASQREEIIAAIHDRMTEMEYLEPLTSFRLVDLPDEEPLIDVLGGGLEVLVALNERYGMAMDAADLEKYVRLYRSELVRNPTLTELLQLAQGQSDHSRHGIFGGLPVIDGIVQELSAMDMVRETLAAHPDGIASALSDDSSGLFGPRVIGHFQPSSARGPSSYRIIERFLVLLATAESHNHPSGISPYPGAATGIGGVLRDMQMYGIGGMPLAFAAGYIVGRLSHPLTNFPWDTQLSRPTPGHLATPIDILIQGSNGASDYANCVGTPLLLGTFRSIDLQLPEERRASLKPTIYVATIGSADATQLAATEPEAGSLIIQLGGPAFPVGIGGGAASSMESGTNAVELDFQSVQRGDPEMEQRMGRVIIGCIEGDNPILLAHDLGAGGLSNAGPEIANPLGARINLADVPNGDPSMSQADLWVNEAQERNLVTIHPNRLHDMEELCLREGCPMAVIGVLTHDRSFVVYDERDDSYPVNLPIDAILGKSARKQIPADSTPQVRTAFELPPDITVRAALAMVLCDPDVGSKQFLTSKADRSVGGLVAQQQCVGPHHQPLADFASSLVGYMNPQGIVMSLGEQPLKMLVNVGAGTRMGIAEALLNMSGAEVVGAIGATINWMWAARRPGEMSQLRKAVKAACRLLIDLGIPIIGGKDSTSMAVKMDDGEVVKAPGQMMALLHAQSDDVRHKVTPDLKRAGNQLVWLDLSGGHVRLGGSILAKVFGEVGDVCPDVEDAELLLACFRTMQTFVREGLIVSSHDISDGGLITALIEMAIGGLRGVQIRLESPHEALETLFSEELGVIIEVADGSFTRVAATLDRMNVPYRAIGQVTDTSTVQIQHNGDIVLDEGLLSLRSFWSSTSQQLELLQTAEECVTEDTRFLETCLVRPTWELTYDPTPTPREWMTATIKPQVAILRAPGTNGDREMAAAFWLAGFDPVDVTMSDLFDGLITLDQFKGIAAPGGFAFGDVLGAGKGWAEMIRHNRRISDQFIAFFARSDTFSLGVCNGAQWMAHLGIGIPDSVDPVHWPRLEQNRSGRFESRIVNLRINHSPALMFRDMADSTLGCWISSGEGRLTVPAEAQRHVRYPLQYVGMDGHGNATYPQNPNGSAYGHAGYCSLDGRHLPMMPHMERLVHSTWQAVWPWMPEEWAKFPVSPWLKAFQNLRDLF